MADLGNAYVQIMPSAKGISGAISKAIQPEATAAGKSAGTSIANSISESLGSLGSTLTKSITLPVVGAATAASGFILKGGWDRIVGLDAARAQLEGLGYDFEAVERISNLVNESIQGTTTTMAQGISVAAGALAAGVKEGAELERYIKLVGSAAIGANRETNEMAMIFNRVQGAGKLMTQELNMIEDGMPGFAQAMADSLGVPQDEFRAMVTAGEVSSEQFLDVMEDFAGGMSDAYSKSWGGIFSRVKSNLAILGENMLEGMFPDAKEALAEFLETIREDDIRDWAKGIGESIQETFNNLIDTIKSLVNWWNDLSDGAKGAIKAVAGIVVAIGPVLTIISKLISAVIGAQEGMELASRAINILKGAFAGKIGTIALVIAAIAAVVGVLVYLYNTNETVREAIDTAWNYIKDLVTLVVSEVSAFVQEIVGSLVTWWQENQELIRSATETAWNFIKDVIQAALDYIMPIVELTWNQIKNATQTVWEVIKTVISTVMDVILGIITAVMAIIEGDWSTAWEAIKGIGSTVWEGIKSLIETAIDSVKRTISNVLDVIFGDWETKWNNIKSTVTGIWDDIKSSISDKIDEIKTTISEGVQSAYDTVMGWKDRFFDAGRGLITSISDGISDAWESIKSSVSSIGTRIMNFLPSSPAKEGPLSQIGNLDFGGPISDSIYGGESEIRRAMNNLMQSTLDNMQLATEFGVSGGFAAPAMAVAGSGSSTEIHVTNNNYSPEALTPREVGRETERSLQRLAYRYR